MSFLATGRVNYQARTQRTELLASRYPFAAEILAFYGYLVSFQRDFHEQLTENRGKKISIPSAGNLRSPLNASIVVEPFRDFLSMLARRGPGPLATEARHLREQGATRWADVLAEFWSSGLMESVSGTELEESATAKRLQDFLPRAFLQPYAEFLVSAILPPVLPMTRCRCPQCNSLPLLGVLRPEGDGAKRYLQCSFCSQEWEFRRIFCAHCGEEEEQKLAVYVAEQFPHMRMETCDTCKHFLRTVDLTKDGKAVPVVDDLAAIPLSLWAQENGYKRIQENLFGS